MADIIVNKTSNNDLESMISRTLLNHLYEGIYFVDTNRKIGFWNQGAETITGYSAAEMIGKHCHDNILNHVDDEGTELCKDLCPLIDAIQQGAYREKRVYLRHKKGHRVPIWVHVSPLKNEEGEIIGAVEVFIDDSDYEKVKKLNTQLSELNDQKNQFVGMAAHDLRNPLSVILGFSDILMQLNNNTGDQSLFMIQKIREVSSKMLVLINDLLDITAIESGRIDLNTEKTELKELFDKGCSTLEIMSSNKKIAIHYQIEKNTPSIEVDPERMSQVIENLVSNAIKYSHSESNIYISAKKVDNSHVAISVKDEGQGIPSEELDKIFEPFHKATPRPTNKESSTGLGLVIVKKIVHLHNGIITVKSEVGQGAEFTVILPVRHG